MTSSAIVQKLWNYRNILRDDGVFYGDYPSVWSILRGCEKIEKTSDSAIFTSTKSNSCGCSFLQNPINSQTLSLAEGLRTGSEQLTFLFLFRNG